MVERAGVPLSGPGSRTGLVPKVGRPVRPVADLPAAPVPPRSLTEDDGRALGSRVWRGYAEYVDPVDRQAVRTYTGDTYEPINDYLRGITTRISDDHRDAITRVDRVIDNAPRVPENMTVSRAIGADVFGLTEGSNLSGLVGRSFQDNGYVSTALQSTLKSVNRTEVELRLDVPSGTRGLYVSSHGKNDDNSLAVYGQIENELLLGRGIDYEITDAAIEDGRRILSAKLVRQRSSNDE
ncbi:ADP-ribosyltransferase [Rhodococcus sp. NPDC078407]|uniref:ADP-ribosyltransferase n=1 Tax=Rhodococcus sp. NPDC078407 TaxID=3364509 RepID=UPI0037CB82D7